ncbi:sensor histidine kinase [Bowmanella dokdonensis]|uniref:Histidine kinase n=1 Tax=Bowmanella dokdonensis TaxID=751969 RepID=A0A939ILF9_9ALTE|nr:histidine kinase [Bowmanella dokdonensis]MBN7824173.1 histidine kinase [Bowmanella dokdonensis]
MTNWRDNISIELLSAMITWALVAGSSLYYTQMDLGWFHWRVYLSALLYSLYMAGFLLVTREGGFRHDQFVRTLLLLALFGIVNCLYIVVPYSYNAVLMAVWSALVPHFIAFRLALWLSPLWSAPLWLTQAFYWGHDYALITALLFWSFNLFALVTMQTTLREQKAREAANQLNRELMATQTLLNQAGKQAERTRIARNIHDLLGHHLTALSINLQVAGRKADGEVKQAVEKCHAIAGLLLSDVREAVAEIREKSLIDLQSALQELTTDLPRIQVDLNIQAEVQDVEQAHAILMCVKESLTNSLKHSSADRISISLSEASGNLQLDIHDNGQQKIAGFRTGNGLRGIQERASGLCGQALFESGPRGFHTRILLPGEMA